MSLTDSEAAMEAARRAYRAAPMKYTLINIHQGPGEGNYDRVERLTLEDVIRAAEKAAGLDEQDTMQMPEDDEGSDAR